MTVACKSDLEEVGGAGSEFTLCWDCGAKDSRQLETVGLCAWENFAVADAMVLSTIVLATALLALGVAPPLVSFPPMRDPPLTISERVLGPSSVEAWLWEVVGGTEVGAVPLSALEELGSGGNVARSNFG